MWSAGNRRWLIAASAIAAGMVMTVSVTSSAEPAGSPRPPGSTIAEITQPDGWHGLSQGSVLDYWTTRSDGTPVPASGAVFLPPGPAPEGGWPVVAYDHGTTGMGPDCGGMSEPGALARADDRILNFLVSHGYAVVAPDYVGLGRFDTGAHPYLELQSEATSTIDLLRAARDRHPELSSAWAVFGPSQGGQAALGVAHLERNYAPDLDFRGAVALDPESDVEVLMSALAAPGFPDIPGLSGPTTGFIAMILDGLRATHPEVDVNSYLTPAGRSLVDDIGSMCIQAIAERTNGMPIGSLPSRVLDDRFRAALDQYMAVPTAGYDKPILLLTNTNDTMVPAPLHAALAAQFLASGTKFRPVIGDGHHSQLSPQMWDALGDFLGQVFGKPAGG